MLNRVQLHRRTIVVTAAALCVAPIVTFAQDMPLSIGVLSDMSGATSETSGKGSVQGAAMAIEDFGGKVLGRPVRLVNADHQNKADVGLSIARQWYDIENVRLIVDVNNSALALAVQGMARDKNRLVVFSGAMSSDLTGKSCSPDGFQWVTDTYTQTQGVVRALKNPPGSKWALLVPDYAFGHTAARDAEAAINQAGGRVVTAITHPAGETNFDSYLLNIQASGADTIGLLQGGGDLVNVLKQASEFGLTRSRSAQLVSFFGFMTDARSVGLDASQGLRLLEPFYWDRTQESRTWSDRFFRAIGKMPSRNHAGAYSAVLHFLKAVQAAGTVDTPAVLKLMHEMPVKDAVTSEGHVMINGRLVRDTFLFQVKTPAASKGPWDVLEQIAIVPGEQTVKTLAETGCLAGN